jgi:hypothetical protein
MDANSIPVGELSVGFSEYALPSTDRLTGERLELHYESGERAALAFLGGEVLKWETADRHGQEEWTCSYRAIMPRRGIYLVDFIVPRGSGESISVVLDAPRKCATVVTGVMPTPEEVRVPLIVRAEKRMPLTPVRAIFEHAAIDGPFSDHTPRHQVTRDLVGERIQWIYSSKDAYEHIYLEENTYCWHCIAGNEKGLADTDRCFFFKIGEKLYLFVWIEKIIPTVGVVIEDLEIMRSYGKIFGLAGYDMNGPATNFPVGSYGTQLNRTEYDLSRLSGAIQREGMKEVTP